MIGDYDGGGIISNISSKRHNGLLRLHVLRALGSRHGVRLEVCHSYRPILFLLGGDECIFFFFPFLRFLIWFSLNII